MMKGRFRPGVGREKGSPSERIPTEGEEESGAREGGLEGKVIWLVGG